MAPPFIRAIQRLMRSIASLKPTSTTTFPQLFRDEQRPSSRPRLLASPTGTPTPSSRSAFRNQRPGTPHPGTTRFTRRRRPRRRPLPPRPGPCVASTAAAAVGGAGRHGDSLGPGAAGERGRQRKRKRCLRCLRCLGRRFWAKLRQHHVKPLVDWLVATQTIDRLRSGLNGTPLSSH